MADVIINGARFTGVVSVSFKPLPTLPPLRFATSASGSFTTTLRRRDWRAFVRHANFWTGDSEPRFARLPRSGRRWAWWPR